KVLRRDDGDRPRPDDTQCGIIMAHTARVAWDIGNRGVIHEIGIRDEREITMCAAFRDVQHPSGLLVELRAEPMAISGTARPKIDRDVEDGAACTAHQFYFGVRRRLVVHTAQRTGPEAAGTV